MTTERSRLHMAGLPDAYAAMPVGSVNCVGSERMRWLHACVSETLLSAEAGLVLDAEVSSPLLGEAHERWQDGRLPVLQWQGGHDLERLHRELEYYRMHQRDLLVVFARDAGLQDADGHFVARNILQWRQWAMKHQIAVLLVQQRIWHAGSLPVQRHAPTLFSGLARLDSRQGPLYWRVYHWSSNEGVLPPVRFPAMQHSDRLELSRNEIPVQTPVESLDEDRLLASMPAVEDLYEYPQDWQLATDNAELVDQAAEAGATTILLACRFQQDFDQLARQVQALRLNLGERIRIVVRERKAVLRHAQMVLLRKLGCNLLIPQEVPASRVHTMLECVQGLDKTPFYSGEIDTLLAALSPFDTRGYLAVPDFVHSLNALLAEMHADVEAVLVVLELLPGVEPQQALAAVQMQRSGDVVTADVDHLWLYFHGCQPAQVATALEHVVQLPLDSLFSSQVQLADPVDIRAQLGRLQQLVEREQWQDYGQWLQQPAQEKELGEESSPGIFQPEPLAPAVAAPLQRKNEA